MLKVELKPSVLASRLLFFMLARLIGGAVSIFVLLFVHFWVGVGLVVLYLFLSVGYYFYLYRLALSVFLLAANV